MRYSQEVKAFIANNVKGTTTRELVKLVNEQFGLAFTELKMRSYKTNHGLKSGTVPGRSKGTYSKVFPVEVRQFVLDNYKGVGPKEMTTLLNERFGTSYTRSQIKSYYGNNKLNSGLKGYFEKGHTPVNKGQKGCAPGCEKGWFKKGELPSCHRPVGSERVDVYGYTIVKVAEPNVWKFKHKLIWEQHRGEIPEKHVVTFLDGDKSHLEIENLALLSMAESLELTRSGLRSENAEFTKTGILITKVKRACRNRGERK